MDVPQGCTNASGATDDQCSQQTDQMVSRLGVIGMGAASKQLQVARQVEWKETGYLGSSDPGAGWGAWFPLGRHAGARMDKESGSCRSEGGSGASVCCDNREPCTRETACGEQCVVGCVGAEVGDAPGKRGGLAPIYRTVMGLRADGADGWEASKATGLR